jgi:hypothetical protein
MPIAMFAMFSTSGRIFLRNRSFWEPESASFYVQWTMISILILIHLWFIFERPEHYSLLELLLLDAFWILRQLVVATKYALISPVETEAMKHEVETSQIRNDRQVITGWSMPSQTLIDTQLLLARYATKILI